MDLIGYYSSVIVTAAPHRDCDSPSTGFKEYCLIRGQWAPWVPKGSKKWNLPIIPEFPRCSNGGHFGGIPLLDP